MIFKTLLNLFDDDRDGEEDDSPSLAKLLLGKNPLDDILNPIPKHKRPDSLPTPKDVKNLFRSFQDKVTPLPGSVVICDLMDIVEHSGIYIGDNTIVHLSGDGNIEAVSPEEFIARLNGRNKSMFIEVSCSDDFAVGSEEVADRARMMIGRSRNYNLILDNCHQFTSGCLSGDFENPHNFMWMLRDEARRVLGADEWRAWKR